MPRRTLYPALEPYDSGHLAVSGLHEIYYEQCGNPHGKPVVLLHGGPGAGCSAKMRRFHDPAKYRIVLFDQRFASLFASRELFAQLIDLFSTVFDRVHVYLMNTHTLAFIPKPRRISCAISLSARLSLLGRTATPGACASPRDRFPRAANAAAQP